MKLFFQVVEDDPAMLTERVIEGDHNGGGHIAEGPESDFLKNDRTPRASHRGRAIADSKKGTFDAKHSGKRIRERLHFCTHDEPDSKKRKRCVVEYISDWRDL